MFMNYFKETSRKYLRGEAKTTQLPLSYNPFASTPTLPCWCRGSRQVRPTSRRCSLLGYVKTISRCKRHRCAPFWDREMHPQPQAGTAWWSAKTFGQQSTAPWGYLWYGADFVGEHVWEEGSSYTGPTRTLLNRRNGRYHKPCTASLAASPTGIRRTTSPIRQSTVRSRCCNSRLPSKGGLKSTAKL